MGYTVDEANKELEKIISGERPATKEKRLKLPCNPPTKCKKKTRSFGF